MEKIDRETEKKILRSQGNEITEYHIYRRLSEASRDEGNRKVLERIAGDELRHYEFWRGITGRDLKPDRLKIAYYYFISRVFGTTFGLKLMERGEERAQEVYAKLAQNVPGVEEIAREEDEHEMLLLDMVREERLEYVGSLVLGLNDALVELTGALAGFSFTFQDTKTIAAAGLITGIAASLSMAASEYLSTKSEGNNKNPLKASLYTGTAYLLTVLFLITPYLVLAGYQYALAATLLNAVMVIFLFTYYISIARDLPFGKRFAEMAGISLVVAAVTYLLGYLIRGFFGIGM
ncbi:MAG: VIT1/CCC1 transporter family protein [Candidatus Altiarchaeota archaeon]|nr:VIT1/CCC1 transporter family protein [Candidatus Altiarchaeota archaeon]